MVLLAMVVMHYQPVFAETGPVSVVDDTGANVSIDAPAQRIISLSPHATELLFEIGAGTHIVGAVDYSDYPLAAKDIPRVGSANRLDIEKIVMLAPDLIVAWHSGNSVQDMKTLSRFNIPVFYSEPRKLDDIATNMDRLGSLTGFVNQAHKQADAARSRLSVLKRTNRSRRRVPVFFQLWHQPLMTVNRDHIISDIMRTCGASNIFAGMAGLTPVVSREAVIQRQPEAIVATSTDMASLKAEWGNYKKIPAVASGSYFLLSPDLLHRQGPRMIRGAEQFCRVMEKVRGER